MVTTYNSEIRLLNAAIQAKGGAGGEPQHLEMDPNRDSNVVSIVVLTIAGEEGPASLDTSVFQGDQKQNVEMARTIVKGSKELSFTSLTNNEVEVQDLSLDRSETDLTRISGRLELLKQKGIVVRFTGALPGNAFKEKRALTSTAH